MSHHHFALASVFPDPDASVILAFFIQQGEVVSVFKQRAIYHKKCWKHASTKMVLRCTFGLLRFGYLDYGHLCAIFYKKKAKDTRLFFIMLKKMWREAPYLREIILNTFHSKELHISEVDKQNAIDQHRVFGIISFQNQNR